MWKSLLFLFLACAGCGIPLGGTGSPLSQDASADQTAGAASLPPRADDASPPARVDDAGGDAGLDAEDDVAPDTAPPPCTSSAECPTNDGVCQPGGLCVRCGANGTDGRACKVGGQCKQDEAKCD